MIDQTGHPDGGGLEPETGAWHWLFASEAGVAVTGPSVSFVSQDAAEDWLREQFEDLEELGIATVTLVDGERSVYGPMFLAPEGAASEEAPAEL